MSIVTEPLNGGLVTSREASLLRQGELTLATNGIYRPYSPALSRLKARSTFQAVGAAVTGLRAVPFDGVTPMAVVYATGTLWRRTSGSGGTDVRTGVTTGKRLEAIHYNNKYVLANGTDTQSVLSSDYTIIGHGMAGFDKGVSAAWEVSPVVGVWNTTQGIGKYGYWITEYDSVNDIESAFIPAAAPNAPAASFFANVTSLTQAVRLIIQYGGAAYPTKINSNATHWRLYRALMTDQTGPEAPSWRATFPLGFRVTTYSSASTQTDEVTDIPIPGVIAPVTRFDQGIPSATPYEIITISVQGSPAVSISRDTTPPIWSTGDIYEDQLVVNDVADKSLIRYSFPGKIHSFPSLYFINVETKQFDEVTHIRTIGDTLVAGLKNQLWRINYLPNETDAEFSRGRCRELISANHGIMGPDAATLFSMAESPPILAYASHDGLYATDGFNVRLLTGDLDWEATVSVADLSTAMLINVQSLFCLFFYFTAAGTAAPNNRVLTLSYAPRHLKEGNQLKIAGPATLTTRAADYGDFKAFATADDIFQEDQGTKLTGTARTRFIYPSDIGGEHKIEREWVLLSGTIDATSSLALRRRFANASDVIDTAVTLPGSALLKKIENHGLAEAFGAELVLGADVEYVAFEYKEMEGR